MIVLDKPEQIEAYRLLCLRSALKLEMRGIRFNHRHSVATKIKREFKLKGTNKKVLEDFEAILHEKGVLGDRPYTNVSKLRT
jgi:hypothetical protein